MPPIRRPYFVTRDSYFLGKLKFDTEVQVIGDALSPRTAEEAVLEGLKVGSEI